MTAALEAVEVSRTFPGGVTALDAVSLAVPRGATTALVGESGSGKTTLLRMFNRTVEPTGGTVRVEGRPAADLDPVALRRATGYVQQEGGLLPHWTVGANITLVPRLLGWDRARRDTRARELLELVGLDPDVYADRHPHELSGGQRQRVAVARSLAADPGVVLLDEPFGALDAITRGEIQDSFLEIQRTVAKTMVLVTHDLDEAFRLGDHVAVLQEGRIVRHGTAAEVEREPGHPYVERLLRHRRRT